MDKVLGIVAGATLIAAGLSGPACAGSSRNDLATFLSGHLVGDGQFRNLVDSTSRKVHVDIHGTVHGSHLQLVEDTRFSDGEHHHKVWQVEKVSEGHYVGQRTDLVGPAQIDARGSEIEMIYKARVPVKSGGVHTLDFDEHFVFAPNGLLTNKMRISFLFVPVGEASLAIRKLHD
jgi:hypothetical protein